LPIACEPGQTCFIQNYFDHDPGPGRKDYACGRLSYDSHEGTDFRLVNYPAMEKGVPVLAAAPGRVLRTRDSVQDINVHKIGRARIKGKEAGNGVVVDHGNGWVTQYSHLKRGSIRIAPGDRIEAGTILGLVGLSGMTEFPHVEFTVRYNGTPLDPFTGKTGFQNCRRVDGTVWTKKTLAKLAYQPTGMLTAGFSSTVPNAEKAREGAYGELSFAQEVEMIVFWVDLFGVQENDIETFKMIGPAGEVLVDQEKRMDQSNVSWFAYAGRRKPGTSWQKGQYQGLYQLFRNSQLILSTDSRFDVR
jgi:murein DD-endopeptidase MepM/ murein hydrolase activator NlpD